MFHYQTTQDKILYTEYGRNIHRFAQEVCEITDVEKRTQAAQALIEIMAMLNPNARQSQDYKEKLWNHLFHICNYKLEVECPYTIVRLDNITPPSKANLNYPSRSPKIRHYGKYIEGMVQKAIDTEDPEKKEAFQEIIGNFMKMAYQDWNNETVTDEQIVIDLKLMSGGNLDVSNTELDVLHRSHKAQRKFVQQKYGNKNFKPNNNNNNNKNKKFKYKKFKKNNNNGF